MEWCEGLAVRVRGLLGIRAFSQEQGAAFDVTGEEQGRVSCVAGVKTPSVLMQVGKRY